MELGSFLLVVTSLDPWVFCPWSLVEVVPVSLPTDALQTEAVCLRPVWAIMGAGAVMSAYVCLPPPRASVSWSIWGAGRLLPYPALVSMAINLAIWCPSSLVPSRGSVVTADPVLVLSWGSSFSFLVLQAAIINWEYVHLGLL